MILKYIILEKSKTAIIFPNSPFSHKDVALNMGTVISAGFCILKTLNNRITINCYGRSTSLNIDSNPMIDKIILEKMINANVSYESITQKV